MSEKRPSIVPSEEKIWKIGQEGRIGQDYRLMRMGEGWSEKGTSPGWEYRSRDGRRRHKCGDGTKIGRKERDNHIIRGRRKKRGDDDFIIGR